MTRTTSWHFLNLIMVNLSKSQVKQDSKKKRVTFSVCMDKRDRYSKEPTQRPNELSNKLPKCMDEDCEHGNESRKSEIVSHKNTGISDAVNILSKGYDVKKTLVRNVEQALPRHCALVRGRPHPSIPIDITHNKLGTDIKSSYKSKYSSPELYTTLCIAKEIQNTARTDTKPSGFAITPAVKQVLDAKTLKKLNFPFEEKLYKDLISLTVCNEELIGNDGRSGGRREVEFKQCKDQEPQLKDFCALSKGKEYNMVEQPVPCGMKRIRRYNGFTLYERNQIWFCDD